MILQSQIPYNPFAIAKLPGISPLDPAAWLARDEAFAAQMRHRDELVATRGREVLAMRDSALGAAQELLEVVLAHVYGVARSQRSVIRPDGPDGRHGVEVAVNFDAPMATLARLVQQDLCVLETSADAEEHQLSAAVLCFPAGWRLADKINQPLTSIHTPVTSYDAGLAKRVQRLFDGVQPGRPLKRMNALWYEDPALFQPRSATLPRPAEAESEWPYLRSELQSLWRLPKSRAVVFSIHSYVLRREDVQRQWAQTETQS